MKITKKLKLCLSLLLTFIMTLTTGISVAYANDDTEKKYQQLADIILEVNPNISNKTALSIVRAVHNECDKYPGIDPPVVLGLIERESTFYANSRNGGLTQVTNSTAREIAKDLNMDSYDLYDIPCNIKMGVYYLNKQFNAAANYTSDYQTQINLALTAYNVGPPTAFKYFKNNGWYSNNYYQRVNKSAAKFWL